MRAGRRRDTWVSLVSSTCLHLLKCSSLLVRPAHMVSFTGCLCHLLLLLLPRPSSIPPHSQGDHSAIHAPRGAQLHEPQDQLPPSSNLCSPITGGLWDTWILWIARLRKEGPLNNAFQLSLEGNKAHPISSLQHPAGPHAGHHSRPTTVPHT